MSSLKIFPEAIHLDFHMIGAIDEAIFYDVNNFKTFAYIQFLFLLYLYYYDSNIIGVKIKIRIRMGQLDFQNSSMIIFSKCLFSK
ncbi:uncharacterized protein OCT59_022564 [Rhizophagus irregularis]|uniref:uncharacterized protein n=1 Tax=Rhizophagus irregularis TaxID=588596 RepID=UPI003322C1F5|nr:hypothetical protein OCT59_022564 [Rhizophagus irregularis]